jgi:hypothetical protein
VAAQEVSRSYQGLFGALRQDDNARQRLDFTLSLAEARDGDIPVTVRSLLGSDVGNQTSGFSTMFLGAMDYRHRSRLQFNASVNSAFRYDPTVAGVQNVSQAGSLSLTAPLPSRTRLTLAQSGVYSPTFLDTLFPAQVTGVAGEPVAVSLPPDYTSSEINSYSATSSITLSRMLGRRSNLSATGDYQLNDFPDAFGNRRKLSVYGIRTEISRPVSRYTSFRAEYHYRTGEYGFQGLGTTSEHGLDVGVEYSRPLSATRRASFGLRGGSSTIGLPEGAVAVGATVDRRFLANGEARFTYQFGRTWEARARYTRGLQYVGQLAQPVFADGVNVGLDGLFNRRLDFQMSGGYSNGGEALTIDSPRFNTYTGDIRLRYAITESLATFVEGYLYVYDFRRATPLLGLPPEFRRDGVRVGLTLWVPTLRK